jgi:hypothetical protein
MGVLCQALKVIFEVQMTRRNEKIARRKISFPTYKTCFFSFFFLCGPLLLSKLITFFYSLFILNDLKFSRSPTLSSTNYVGTLAATEQHTRNVLGV